MSFPAALPPGYATILRTHEQSVPGAPHGIAPKCLSLLPVRLPPSLKALAVRSIGWPGKAPVRDTGAVSVSMVCARRCAILAELQFSHDRLAPRELQLFDTERYS